MLLGEDRRRHEHQDLLAVDRDGERGAHGDLGLAEADVAADEPVHRPRRLEVLLDGLDRVLLVGRLAVRERRLELLQPLVLEVVGDALARLPLRVERDQLAGELLHRLARARLEQLPRLAAELRERGRGRVGADVARHLAELLVRDVEAVLAAEREQEVVARDAGDLLRLEAEQLPDAVVLVHDVVAGAQVGERLQRAAAERGSPATRGDGRPGGRAGERAGGRARRSRDARARRRRRAPASSGSLSSGSRIRASTLRSMFCVRSASPRCGNATTTRCPERTSAASSVSASARPRAAIAGRCASNENGWLCGNESSSVVPFSEIGWSLSSSQMRRTSSGWKTKSGARSSGATRSFGTGPDLALVPVPVLHQVEPPLGRRIDRARLDRVQRALRERRERANRLDLVAEELDAQRLAAGRREDVDDAAAHRELAAVVDALDALVAGDRERFREPLDADLASRAELERLRSRARRRQRLRERAGRRADEPAGGEDAERAGPLADEMRRRLEPGLPADAAARQEPDLLLAEEPGRRLGGVAGVGVLGQQADERPLELLVERREHDRQRRLRDAGARRQRLGELFEALQVRELRGRMRGVRDGPCKRRNLAVPRLVMVLASLGRVRLPPCGARAADGTPRWSIHASGTSCAFGCGPASRCWRSQSPALRTRSERHPCRLPHKQQRDMLIGMRGTNQSVPADYPGGPGTVCSEESFDGTTRRWLCLVWQINIRHLPVLQPPAYAGACTHLLADQQQARWICLGTDPVPQELPPPPVTGHYA